MINILLDINFFVYIIYIMGNPWMDHVKTVRKANPGKQLKEILKMAGKTYKKQAKAPCAKVTKSNKKTRKVRKSKKGSRKGARKGTRKARKTRKSRKHKGGSTDVVGAPVSGAENFASV
jgi:hypothetical protein